MSLVVEAAGRLPAWTLRWGVWRWHLTLVSGRLVASCAGPGRTASAEPDGLGHLAHPALDAYRGLGIETAEHGPESFQVETASIEDDGLVLALRGERSGLLLVSEWRVDTADDVVTHRVEIRAPGGADLCVTRADSLGVDFDGPERTTTLRGTWARETQRVHSPVDSSLLLESRSGKTGFEHAPYLAAHADGWTAVVALAWSGNWRMRAQTTGDGRLRVCAGLHPWRLAHRVDGVLELPAARVVLAPDLGEATRRLHRHRRRLLGRTRTPQVQFNSWYPYPNAPHLDAMTALADRAARLGCETFVQDAGWYTNAAAREGEDWRGRVGDWLADEQRFPGGLRRLAAEIRSRGLEPGIWVEPEMAAATSIIGSEHPEWLHATETTPLGRSVVDLGNPDALAAVTANVVRVLEESSATWLKWDFNADLQVPPGRRRDPGRDPVVEHVRGVYALQEAIRRARPDVVLEMCAGGGGRLDHELMGRATTSWMSDQTQPLPNLSIHFGAQLAYLPEECNDWLIDWPPHDTGCGVVPVDDRGDLDLRAVVPMLGAFGVSAPLERWSSADLDRTTAHVAWYKSRVRPLLGSADQHLLTAQPGLDGGGEWAAAWSVAPGGERGHILAVRLADGAPSWAGSLPGLDPERTYAVADVDGERGRYTGAELAGGALEIRRDVPFTAAALAVLAV